ncbi:MAG: TolC family protein [Marinilabiliaceae bacterium]|nr:TolC family protein [Marinilabiliaceae bacterium]
MQTRQVANSRQQNNDVKMSVSFFYILEQVIRPQLLNYLRMKTTKYLLSLSILLFGGDVISQTLSLDSCKIYALENNKQIKEAKLKIEESDQLKKSTFTNFFPKVSAQAITMKVNDYLVDVETPEMNLPVYNGNPATLSTATQFAYLPGMSIQTLDNVNMGMISAIEPVYAGGRVRSGYKLASLNKEVHIEMLNMSIRDVVIKTEEYYWSLVALTAKRQTLERYKALLTRLLSDVQVSFDAGLIQKSDLLKVQLKINEVNTNQLKLENGISMLKMVLCQHIGINYNDAMQLSDTTIVETDPNLLFVAPAQVLQNRTEYRLLNKAIDAEVLQKRLTRGEFLPQLAIGVQGLYLGFPETNVTSMGQTSSHSGKDYTYGIAFATVSIPISDWWGGSHKIKEHKIKIDIARNSLDEKSELLILQINKSFNELNESFEQIKVAQSLLEQATEHLKVVNDNYEAGIMSTSDLLEAQAMNQEAEAALVDAKSNYRIKQILYKHAVAKEL